MKNKSRRNKKCGRFSEKQQISERMEHSWDCLAQTSNRTTQICVCFGSIVLVFFFPVFYVQQCPARINTSKIMSANRTHQTNELNKIIELTAVCPPCLLFLQLMIQYVLLISLTRTSPLSVILFWLSPAEISTSSRPPPSYCYGSARPHRHFSTFCTLVPRFS